MIFVFMKLINSRSDYSIETGLVSTVRLWPEHELEVEPSL